MDDRENKKVTTDKGWENLLSNRLLPLSMRGPAPRNVRKDPCLGKCYGCL